MAESSTATIRRRWRLLDWEMPGLQGPEVVQRIRSRAGDTSPTYVILLTVRDSSADIVQGLKAGADDYVTKPANEDELIARVNVGARVVQLQTALADRVRSLEEALANVKALQTLLPMCAYCKSIRNDQNYWEKVETYFTQHSNVSFTHSYCPNCYERFVRPELEALEGVEAAQDRHRQGRWHESQVLDPCGDRDPEAADAAGRA